MKGLSVGFFRFDPYMCPVNPLIGAAAGAPATYRTVTIGGPETREQVLEKIEACEKLLSQLRAQLAGLP